MLSLILLTGTQEAGAVTTTISTDTTIGDLTVSPGDTLQITSGATLDVTGTLTVQGTLINDASTIDNLARIHNQGTFENHGTLLSGDGGVNNENTGVLNNFGTINLVTPGSSSLFENNGILNNMVGGSIIASLDGTPFSNNAGGIVNNFGSISGFGQGLYNAGILNNEVGGIVTVTGGEVPFADLLFNNLGGTFYNHGTVQADGTSGINNGGTFYNICTGIINNSGIFEGNPIINISCITLLVNNITSLNLPNAVTSSLTSTLKNIDLDKIHPACGKLDAFINKVNEDLSQGKLTKSQASPLLDQANAIKTTIGC